MWITRDWSPKYEPKTEIDIPENNTFLLSRDILTVAEAIVICRERPFVDDSLFFPFFPTNGKAITTQEMVKYVLVQFFQSNWILLCHLLSLMCPQVRHTRPCARRVRLWEITAFWYFSHAGLRKKRNFSTQTLLEINL